MLFLNGLKYLFHNFGVKDFPRMERQNDSSLLLHVNPMTTFGTNQDESGFQQLFLSFLGR